MMFFDTFRQLAKCGTVAMLLFGILPVLAGEGIEHFPSPDGLLRFAEIPNKGSKDLMIFQGSSKAGTHVEQIDRWAEVHWDVNGKYFALENHRDGHITNLIIFRVEFREDAAPPRVEEVYRSPAPLQYDSHWKLIHFDVRDGTAKIQCRFRYSKDGVIRGGDWFVRQFVIPIAITPHSMKSAKTKKITPHTTP